jgi:uncharacterized protein
LPTGRQVQTCNSNYNMKTILILLIVGLQAFSAVAQKINPNYDSTLAKKYSADDYGMKMYVLVILKTGSNTTDINRLVKINKLVVAGPLVKNERTYRGIFILDVKTFEEANTLLETDPAIKEKLLAVELYQWYGSAALPAYLETSDKIWKKGF